MFARKQIGLLAGLLGIALGTVGSTCVIVEEGPGPYEEPGINDETLYEHEEEIVEESKG